MLQEQAFYGDAKEKNTRKDSQRRVGDQKRKGVSVKGDIRQRDREREIEGQGRSEKKKRIFPRRLGKLTITIAKHPSLCRFFVRFIPRVEKTAFSLQPAVNALT